jgi:hypothetical protein
MTISPSSIRELDSRVNDGIEVRLLWRPWDTGLHVTVVDTKQGGAFCLEVADRGRALDVFQHPYAYAAERGVDTRAAAGSPKPASVLFG